MHERGTDMARHRTGDISNDPAPRSRRTFLSDMARAGGSMIGIGAFVQACAEREIAFTTDLAEHYIVGVRAIIASIRDREIGRIHQAAALAVQTRLKGHELFASLHGAMIVNDTRQSRPGGTPYTTPCTIKNLPATVHHVAFRREGLPELDLGRFDFAQTRQIHGRWDAQD